jgi:hypothetical protein
MPADLAAIDVLTVRTIVRMIVRMGASPELLHCARLRSRVLKDTRVAEVFSPSNAGGFVPAAAIGQLRTTSPSRGGEF